MSFLFLVKNSRKVCGRKSIFISARYSKATRHSSFESMTELVKSDCCVYH